MRTWIKITEGDKEKAIKELEKLAIDKPKVCIMDNLLEFSLPDIQMVEPQWTMDYFRDLEAVTLERCKTIISTSGEPTGEYDFYFEWIEEPEKEYLEKLKKEVTETLNPLKVNYELVNK